MKKSIQQFNLKRKEQVDFRTDQNCAEFGSQQLSQSPVVYEIAGKFRAVAHGCSHSFIKLPSKAVCMTPLILFRLVILRKMISVKKEQELLFPEIRYFFYLTNDTPKSDAEIVFESNDRCNQENLIGQLKSGTGVLRIPPDNLYSNWIIGRWRVWRGH